MTTSPARALVLYDADCGFCSLAAGWIPLLRADVDVRSLQSQDLAALGVDADRCVREMPMVLPGGQVAWGHHAWAEILTHSPAPLPLLGRALGSRVLEPVGAAVYAWIAGHRHQLPGGTATCALPPAGPPQAPGRPAPATRA